MPVDRRLLIGGTVIAGGGIAYYLYKKNKSKQAAAAVTGAAGYGYGYGYGLQGQVNPYAYGYGFGASGLGEYGYGGFSGGMGAYGAGTPGGSAGTAVPQTATNNAQWSEAAVSALTNQGYDGTAVLAALGQYLVGGTLTSDQQSIVSAAIAAEGYPPQSGPNGYPPAMNTSAQSGQTTGGTTPPQPGGGTTPAHSGAISNLQPVKLTKNSFTVRWNPAQGATQGYAWNVHQMNSVFVKGGNTRATTVTVTGLHPGWEYNFAVQGLPGGAGDNIHVGPLPAK